MGLFSNRVLSPATFMDAREIPDSTGDLLHGLTGTYAGWNLPQGGPDRLNYY